MWFLLGDWQIFVNLTPEAGDVAFTRPEVTSHIYSYVIGTSTFTRSPLWRSHSLLLFF